MRRFAQATIDEDREALRTARQDRLRANNLRITHALGGLDEYAWEDVVSDDYDSPTEADVTAAGRRAMALEVVLALLRSLATKDAKPGQAPFSHHFRGKQ
tara:strand:- start:3103 stop:3402 length:300 start_codon:yes stop_codon:yes gene_type:complete